MRSLIAGKQFFSLTKSSLFPSTPSSNIIFNKNIKTCASESNNDKKIMNSPILNRQLIGSLLERPSDVFIQNRSRSHGVCAPVYAIKLAQCDDRDRLLNFLRFHYYREEPLRLGSNPPTQDANDENFLLQFVPSDTCVLVVRPDQNDSIVAAICATPRQPNSLAGMSEAFGPYSKWGRILKIMARVEKEAKACERYGVNRALHAYALAVHQSYRGYGLGMRAIRGLAALGRKMKIELLTIDATSIYAACLCQRLGMKMINLLIYANHIDDRGVVIFTPPGPSDAIRTYAMRL